MMELKLRAYDKKHDAMYYVDDLYFFEENQIHELSDFQDYETPMFFTGRVDNGGAELWEGDKLTNRYVYGEIIYSEEDAAFMMKYLNLVEDNLISIKEALRRGFYRIGNVYCDEH